MAAGGRTWGRATSAAGAWRAGTSPWRGSAGPAARGTTRATGAGGSQCPSSSARRTCARRCDARGVPPSPSLPRARRAPASPARARRAPNPGSRAPRAPFAAAASARPVGGIEENNIPSDSPRIRTGSELARAETPNDSTDRPKGPSSANDVFSPPPQKKKTPADLDPPVASLPPSATSSAAASAAAPRATPR